MDREQLIECITDGLCPKLKDPTTPTERELWRNVSRPVSRNLAIRALDALTAAGMVVLDKKTLADHWLVAIHCDHEAKTDTAQCSCSKVAFMPKASVGLAVNDWIEHLFNVAMTEAANAG